MTTINTIGVIGAGQMGAGIAQVAAMSGHQTVLFDAAADQIARGRKGISASLAKFVEKQKISADQKSAVEERIKNATSLKELAGCDLVIEAIVENTEIKLKLFSELDQLLGKHAILASNTSSISITKLAAGSKRATNFIGMHFMNPVPLMALVEVIRGLQTSDETDQAICALSAKMGKTVVHGVDSPGFVVNRILVPMINEAIYLLQEGVKAEDIDNAMKLGTNQPMGPLTLADFVGLDTLLSICRVLQNEIGDDKYRPCPLLVKYVEAGWFGKKSGRGFYQY